VIIGVAVIQKQLMICLPKPNRHHDCIKYAIKTLGLIPPISSKSGFYLEDGRFLDRKDALVYARENNQLINKDAKNQLYSEDIW
jgi:hypothetical protein